MAMLNGSPFMPLTVGIHQRCDDSYFKVWFDGVSFWWYDLNEDGSPQNGPYSTAEIAAENGWAND